jgi:drug/metabolite transporter (DMT)-like permease
VNARLGYAALTYFLFSASDAGVKLLTARYDPLQILGTMALGNLLPVIVVVHFEGGWRSLAPKRPLLILLRVAAGFGGGVFGFHALAHLPLAEVYALTFLAPVVAIFAAQLILRERADARAWLAVAIGFAGVLAVLQPVGMAPSVGHVFALVAMLFSAGALLVLRWIGPIETRGTLACAMALGMAALTLPTFPWIYRTAPFDDLAMMAACGILSGCAQIALVHTLKKASVAAVAPFQFSMLFWGLAFGYLLFDQLPQPAAIAGAILIVAANFLVLARTRTRP